MEKTSENDKTSDLQDSAQTVGSPAAKVDKIPSSAWKTLAILSSIATLVMYTETMLVPSLPNIIEEFGLTYSISPWILTTYLIVGAVMTPVTSSLAEIYGKKKILLIVMAVYAAGVIVGGLTTDLYSFIIARGMQGVGMSMFPIAFGVIREQFPKSRLAIGQGVITSMFASGSILGLLVGATIAEFSGWRTTFLSILPIAILLPIVVWRFAKIGEVHPDWQATAPTVQHTQTRSEIKRTLDIKGAATLAATITLFLLSLTFIETTSNNGDGANASGNMQPASLLLILSISCIATFAAFLVVERRAAHPLIDLSLLKNKILLFTNVMMIILGFSMFMVFQTIPILAESPPPAGFGDSVTGAASIQLPFSIILLIFGPTSGYIVSRLGSIRPAIMGYSINAIGFFMLAAFHSQPWMVSVALAIISTGLSLGSVGLMNIVLLATPHKNMVTSIGMTSLLRIVGSSVGPAVAGVFMQTRQITVQGHAGSFPSPESYTTIFLTAAVMSAISIVMALKIRQSLLKSQRDLAQSAVILKQDLHAEVKSDQGAKSGSRNADKA
ncbi:MAG TPA: MFS transporter [Nitrososphaera sp.]|nr:MFS transporter [Nitrososphaera sp.]